MAQPPQGAVDGRCLHLVLNAIDAGAPMVGKSWENMVKPNALRKIVENIGVCLGQILFFWMGIWCQTPCRMGKYGSKPIDSLELYGSNLHLHGEIMEIITVTPFVYKWAEILVFILARPRFCRSESPNPPKVMFDARNNQMPETIRCLVSECFRQLAQEVNL